MAVQFGQTYQWEASPGVAARFHSSCGSVSYSYIEAEIHIYVYIMKPEMKANSLVIKIRFHKGSNEFKRI